MQEFEMSDKQLAEIRKTSRLVTGSGPYSQVQKANEEWQRLGNKLGFVWNTVRPSREEGGNPRRFRAEPVKTEQERN